MMTLPSPSLNLTIVGCSGSYPVPGNPASSYLLQYGGENIVMDLGNGSFGELQKYLDLEDPDSLQAVVISHGHSDHCADLIPLFVLRRWHPHVKFPLLDIYGPPGLEKRISDIMGDPIEHVRESFTFHEMEEDEFSVGSFNFTTKKAVHSVPAVHVRADTPNGNLTFSGDTDESEKLVQLATGTDIALFEAASGPYTTYRGIHSSGEVAGLMAKESGAKNLFLTHLANWNDNEEVVQVAERAYSSGSPLHRVSVMTPGFTWQSRFAPPQ